MDGVIKTRADAMLCVKALLLLLLTVSVSAVAERSPEAMPGEGELTDHFRRMTTYHERMDGNVPEGAVLFIGDSITQGLCVSAICAHGVNYGIGSDTTAGVLERLPLYASIERSAAVVLAIGVNDLRRREDKFILENLRDIIEAVTRHVPVVVSAVLPLDERVEAVGPDRNARIAALNSSIASLCADYDACVYADASSLLLDAGGSLAAAYHVGDGVHPNTAGYDKWISILRKGLDKALSTERGAKKK
jgi:lysophospholipase L1-like esterase